MSSAAARAEARRKAILSRGSDRLAKLTTSARGEDASSVFHDDPPLAQIPTMKGSTFVGESTADMPVPRPASSSLPTPAQTRVSASPEPSGAASASASTSASASSNANANANANTRRRGTTPSRNANIFESLGSGGMATDPSVWLPEQQQQFMQALMNAASSSSSGGAGGPGTAGMLPSPFGEPQDPLQGAQVGSEEGAFNALAALMGAPQAGAGGAGGGGAGMFPPFGGPGVGVDGKFPAMGPLGMGMGMGMGAEPPKEKTRLQKVMPLLHLIAMWCLLAYFVLWAEPRAYAEATGAGAGVLDGAGVGARAVGLWRRWAELGRKGGVVDVLQGFKIQVVPFFWAFTTLQIILHSLRIFSGFDAVQPPTLLALALPHLPQPLPSLIINALKYMQMGSLFLDDLSGVVVGIGFIVYFSGWLASRET